MPHPMAIPAAATTATSSLRRRLLASPSAVSYGPMVLSASPAVAELLSGLGYGHVAVDMEHSPLSVSALASVLRAVDAAARRRTHFREGIDPDDLFDAHDANGDGTISLLEFRAMLPRLGLNVSDERSRRLFEVCDADGSGEIDRSEFRSALLASSSEGKALLPPSATPVVRVPSHADAATTKRVLDVLVPPGGIIFPMVETADDAAAAVSSARYPDRGGVRGCAHPFVRASGFGSDVRYYESASDDVLVAVQVESADAIQRIPDIAAVEGVDCIFLGPFDISCSIGKMGQFEEGGEVMELMREAESMVREAKGCLGEKGGPILGGFRIPGRSVRDMVKCGYRFICGGVDLGLLRNAAIADLEAANDASNNTECE